MNIRFYYTIVAIVGMTAYGTMLAACGDKSSDKSSASSLVSSLTRPPSNPSAAPPAFADADLAVPEDFEVDARKAVTADTYRNELTAIAKEIEAPK